MRERRNVNKADLNLAEALLNSMGAKIAALDVQPGRLRITTTEGRELNLDENEELDIELNDYRRKRGNSSP
jgi:hypothetical protein